MPRPDAIEEYLGQLAFEARAAGLDPNRLVEEARDHLARSVQQGQEPPDAVARFGDPRSVAWDAALAWKGSRMKPLTRKVSSLVGLAASGALFWVGGFPSMYGSPPGEVGRPMTILFAVAIAALGIYVATRSPVVAGVLLAPVVAATALTVSRLGCTGGGRDCDEITWTPRWIGGVPKFYLLFFLSTAALVLIVRRLRMPSAVGVIAACALGAALVADRWVLLEIHNGAVIVVSFASPVAWLWLVASELLPLRFRRWLGRGIVRGGERAAAFGRELRAPGS